MAKFRFKALQEALSRAPLEVKREGALVSGYFGINVFDRPKMTRYLSKEAFMAVSQAIDLGEPVDRKMVDQVAQGMKAWAVEHGATHYTHWFHPLTDGTAEKHEAFVTNSDYGGIIESFSGKLLAQQNPDASFFPVSGSRHTFEARGYTAWDASSPAFIVDGTLCIPTVFVSYTGEALDYKTPLLRALSAVDKAATAICQYFDKTVMKVQADLGWEQEYFLVDEALFMARPDLILAGRTLMGHASAKDQQLDDHYFSSIPTRVYRFMEDFENEAYKLGIPIKTRHNEVAPNQFEVAALFEEANLSNDHNQLLMDIMKKVGDKHRFRVLFHEKPFAGINGSGKHMNWSLRTDTGVNLFSPGKNPKANLQFLAFVVNTLKAVHDNRELLKACIMTAGNSLRLGMNEAPTASISVFLGSEVTTMLDLMEEFVVDRKMTPDEKTALKLNIGRIPEIILDRTDRNRIAPLAFAGNRFEFRSVGSSSNCAAAMIVLNTIVAEQLTKFGGEVDKLVDKGVKKDEAVFQVLKRLIIESKPVCFEQKAKTGQHTPALDKKMIIPANNAPSAISAYTRDDVVKLFADQEVFTAQELNSRTEVEYGKFTRKVQIESRVMGDLAVNHIIPVAVKYQITLLENMKSLKEILGDDEYVLVAPSRIGLIREIEEHISAIRIKVDEMTEARKAANVIDDEGNKANAYELSVRPYIDDIRHHIDKLELIVDNELWPLPKYRELLFIR